MRVLVGIAAILGSFIAVSAPAYAQPGAITADKPIFYDAFSSQLIDQPWPSERPRSQPVERPFADLLATKLGVAQGKAELFRFQIENAPSNGTMLKGFVDGVGIKLKSTW